jgi:hypothetical protein
MDLSTEFLVFTVDEGLTNQRIGIVSGLLIASLMGRTVSSSHSFRALSHELASQTFHARAQAVLPKLKTSYHPEAGQEVLFDAM